MSRKSKIRWRDDDYEKLRSEVKKYNDKIRRERNKLLKQYDLYMSDPDKYKQYKHARYAAAQLPHTTSMKELTRDRVVERNGKKEVIPRKIQTRADLKAELTRMENFRDTGFKFKLGEKLEESLHATVRDFNSKVVKIRSGTKNQGELAALPRTINPRQLLQNVSSPEELKGILGEYKKFLEKGAEEIITLSDTKHNIKTTRWQKETMERGVAIVNANREAEIEAWRATEVSYGGKSAGYTQGQARLDKGDYDEFAPINTHTWSSTHGDLHRKLDQIMRERNMDYWNGRTELARINYITKMNEVIGNSRVGKKLIRKINSLELQDFKRVLKGEDDLFLLLYDIEQRPENYEILLEKVWNEWFEDEDFYDWYEKTLEQ